MMPWGYPVLRRRSKTEMSVFNEAVFSRNCRRQANLHTQHYLSLHCKRVLALGFLLEIWREDSPMRLARDRQALAQASLKLSKLSRDIELLPKTH
ncbi:MAG: hypothetical protein C0469_15215 [Cyanobacteria bacterium DS2.3.42]|nr:hypothetical protein [Cyanobacteria bacterium DS2.3.42]